MASEGSGSWQAAPPQGGPGTSDNILYILRIGKALLLGFIRTLWQRYRASQPQVPTLEQTSREDLSAEATEDIPDAGQVMSLQECMVRIWRDLSGNAEITRMAESVTGENPLEVLAAVSEQMFADGINWGRIVAFSYFAYKIIVQFSSNWFHTVVDWAMTFLQNRLANWIQQKGGWIAKLLSIFWIEV